MRYFCFVGMEGAIYLWNKCLNWLGSDVQKYRADLVFRVVLDIRVRVTNSSTTSPRMLLVEHATCICTHARIRTHAQTMRV